MLQKQIFLSHRSSQKAWLKERLIPKLDAAGFKVWLDKDEIAPLEPITEKVRQGIAESHLFLAWWFDEYEASEPCHFELITALAHCRAEGEHSYQQRVFFAGPDAAREYAEAGIFKGLLARPLSTPPTEAELDALVAALNQRAEAINAECPFGATKLDDANRVSIPPDTNFVGRAKELLQLFGRLIPAPAGTEGGNTAVMLVSGIGGEGKTELAKEFTRRFGAWFTDSLRLGLQGDAGEGTLSARLTTGLRFEAKARGWPLEGVESLHDLRGLFERSMKRPFLWLLDDLPSSTTKEEGEFLVAPLRGGISLLTGRATVPGLANFKLDELSQEDGTRLLARLAAAQLTEAERLALYRAVNGHALSLNLIGHGVAAGLTANEFLSPATPLIDRLEEVGDLIDRDKLGLKAVLPTLLVSLGLIPQDHPAQQVLALIAQLASAPVPVKLLEQALEKGMRVKAISFLENRGFLTRDIRQTEACLRLHPLLADVVRALPEEFGTAEALAPLLDAVDKAFRRDLQAIIDDAGHFRRTTLSPLLLPHARHRAAAGLVQDKPDLAGDLGYALYVLGDLPGARVLQEKVLEARRRILGPEHPAVLTSLNNLAGTLRAQGDQSGARALQEQVLEARRRILGPEHPDTLISMGNLASILRAQGDLPGARALQEQVQEIRRRILGPEHPKTLISLNNLASTLADQGDLPGARALQEQVLEIRRRILGPEHPKTLISLNNLASTLWAQGDLPGARALQEQVLEIRRRILGPEHPATLTGMNNLAGTLQAQGDLTGARALQEQGLEAHRRILGPEHPDTLNSMNNLAGTLRAQGNLPGARVLQEQGLEIRYRTLGPEHPDTLRSINNLAITLFTLGETAAARDLVRPILPMLPTLTHAEARTALTDLARHLNLLPPEAP